MNNELGNIVIDHNNRPATPGDFYAYQAFVAPSSSSGTHNNEAWLGVSADGGHTWADNPIACSTEGASTDLNHNFPNVSVDPAGNLWYAWSTITRSSPPSPLTTARRGPAPARQHDQRAGDLPWLAATSQGRGSRLLRRADDHQPDLVRVLRPESERRADGLGYARSS